MFVKTVVSTPSTWAIPVRSVQPGRLVRNMQGTSWMLQILPFMEYGDIYKQWNFQKSVLGNAALAERDIKGFPSP